MTSGSMWTLFVVFLVLKLTATIDWSWWWVTAPLWAWMPVALLIWTMVIGWNVGEAAKQGVREKIALRRAMRDGP